jgi:hypothetical protein
MLEHCCQQMRTHLSRTCPDHPDGKDCPDVVIEYYPKSKCYGLPIHDGGTSFIAISHCPWCGGRVGSEARA